MALGNANNGGNAGVGCLNGNNVPSNARANNGAVLNNVSRKDRTSPKGETHRKVTARLVAEA